MQNWEEEEEYDIEACSRSSNRSRVVPTFQRNGSLICSAPFLLIDSFSRKSLSYDKLPAEPLYLTILKLDGTSFEIQVLKNGTVGELKQAVEDSFSHLPKKGAGMISWSHVWGHFCLYYDGQKLLKDSEYIGSYGIQDGDQLEFIRHVSINYNAIGMHSAREDPDLDDPSISDGCEDRQQNGVKSGYDDNDKVNSDKDNSIIMSCEYKFKLTNSVMRIEQRSSSAKISNSSLGSFSNMLRLSYSNKFDSL